MKERPDLNILAKEVFEANKAKGFHDEERSNETLLMLVITELSEAVEADRKTQRANLNDFDVEIERLEDANNYNNLTFSETFENYIKDTVEDELADSVIRLLDLAGLRGYELEPQYQYHADLINEVLEDGSFVECIYLIVEKITILNYFESDEAKVRCIITYIDSLCESLSIDLWHHVELKLKYNQTRPTKHGKNY